MSFSFCSSSWACRADRPDPPANALMRGGVGADGCVFLVPELSVGGGEARDFRRTGGFVLAIPAVLEKSGWVSLVVDGR